MFSASIFTAQSAGGNNTTAVVALQLLGAKSEWKPVEIEPELTEQAAAAKAVSIDFLFGCDVIVAKSRVEACRD